jgi:FkbM family methyltransferase
MHDPRVTELLPQFLSLRQQVAGMERGLLSIQRRVMALDAHHRLALAGRQARYPVEFRSEYGEDVWLWELFEGRLEGFFIEVGAYDGYTNSTSYAFEASGWRGLLVEPIPRRFEACRARRSGVSRVVHGAAGAPGGAATIDFTVVEDDVWDLCSYALDRPQHRPELDRTDFKRSKVTVPMTTLNAELEAMGHAGPIDFATIDVEGAEWELLQGLDLKRWKPRVVIIEDLTRGKDARAANHMKGQEYEFLGWLAINRLYVHREERALLARAAAAV